MICEYYKYNFEYSLNITLKKSKNVFLICFFFI